MSKTLFEKHLALHYPNAVDTWFERETKSLIVDYGTYALVISEVARNEVLVSRLESDGKWCNKTEKVYTDELVPFGKRRAMCKVASPKMDKMMIDDGFPALPAFPISADPMFHNEVSHAHDPYPHFHFRYNNNDYKVVWSSQDSDFTSGSNPVFDEQLNMSVGFCAKKVTPAMLREIGSEKENILLWGIENSYDIYAALMKASTGLSTMNEAYDRAWEVWEKQGWGA